MKKKAEERTEIQKKITDLSAKRQKKVDEELAKKPKTDAEKALDDALKGIIRDQAKSKGFEIPAERNEPRRRTEPQPPFAASFPYGMVYVCSESAA